MASAAPSHKCVAAEHGMRTSLFGTAVENQHRGFALLVNGIVDFRVGHEFDLNPVRGLCKAEEESKNGERNS